jgi:hypothetical protein
MVRPADWAWFWPFWSSCFCWVGFDLNPRAIARDRAEETPHSLRERIARFAMAINGCSGRAVPKPSCEQAKWELMSEPDTGPTKSVLKPVPGSERWHPVPGSTRHKLPVAYQGFHAG